MLPLKATSEVNIARDERGFTVVELLAAVVIVLVIVAAAMTTLVSSNRTSHVNSQVADTQQNVRVAVDLLSKDIRLAGFNYDVKDPMTPIIGACSAGGRPVGLLPQDQNPAGADSGPDRVSMVVPVLTTTTTPWVLSAAAGNTPPNPIAPFTTITMSTGAVDEMTTQGLGGGAVISLSGAVSRRVLSVSGGIITLESPVEAQFPIGTPVYLLQCIQYQISTSVATCGSNSAPCLLRNGIPIVDGVEDLQLAYACDGCNTGAPNPPGPDGVVDEWDSPANGFTAGDFVSNASWSGAVPFINMRPQTIKLAQVSIVARQTGLSEGTSERGTPGINSAAPIIISDHDPSNPGDPGFNLSDYQRQRRRVLTRSVQPRNL